MQLRGIKVTSAAGRGGRPDPHPGEAAPAGGGDGPGRGKPAGAGAGPGWITAVPAPGHSPARRDLSPARPGRSQEPRWPSGRQSPAGAWLRGWPCEVRLHLPPFSCLHLPAASLVSSCLHLPSLDSSYLHLPSPALTCLFLPPPVFTCLLPPPA